VPVLLLTRSTHIEDNNSRKNSSNLDGDMVRIRLRRVGARNRPIYRIVVADDRAPRDGRFIEIVGHYNPLTKPETVVIDKEKAEKWLKCGAQPSDTVAALLAKFEIIEKPKLGTKKRVATKAAATKTTTDAASAGPASKETSTP
jgi:small subunit ribosomal protein S16